LNQELITLEEVNTPLAHLKLFLFGKWIIDNEYVIIKESQDDAEKTITLKVISNHELKLLGSSSNALLLRC
jgi:hypothetical protein